VVIDYSDKSIRTKKHNCPPVVTHFPTYYMATEIPPTLKKTVLQAIEKKKAHKPRKESEYTTEEREVIGKYKDEYIRMTQGDAREQLLRKKILVPTRGSEYRPVGERSIYPDQGIFKLITLCISSDLNKLM
jgi:hypothetical protein